MLLTDDEVPKYLVPRLQSSTLELIKQKYPDKAWDNHLLRTYQKFKLNDPVAFEFLELIIGNYDKKHHIRLFSAALSIWIVLDEQATQVVQLTQDIPKQLQPSYNSFIKQFRLNKISPVESNIADIVLEEKLQRDNYNFYMDDIEKTLKREDYLLFSYCNQIIRDADVLHQDMVRDVVFSYYGLIKKTFENRWTGTNSISDLVFGGIMHTKSEKLPNRVNTPKDLYSL